MTNTSRVAPLCKFRQVMGTVRILIYGSPSFRRTSVLNSGKKYALIRSVHVSSLFVPAPQLQSMLRSPIRLDLAGQAGSNEGHVTTLWHFPCPKKYCILVI